MAIRIFSILLLLFFLSCSGPNGDISPALESISSAQLLDHIKVLSADEFEGRAPGSKGEDLTVDYLIRQFKDLGLKPGNPDGTYLQQVPLMGFTSTSTASIRAGKKTMRLAPLKDYVAVSRRFVPNVRLKNSEIVFVGYGVVAPEYGWDDYKDVDVKGKTILMLINDPAVPDPKNPEALDPAMFKGKAMTYYGRWTYKFEIASERGAAAAIIIHETGPAGYPFEVVSGSWGRENFDIHQPDKNRSRVAAEGWITNEVAKGLLKEAGMDFDKLKKTAADRNFRPVALNASFTIDLKNALREIQSNNVIALLEGSEFPSETILYTAHWDHLGKDPSRPDDQVFNGALDNASGTAGMIEIAEAFTKLLVPPKRSIVFLAVTAEEKGLLGAKYYAENPLYPYAKTLANINIDGMNQWGRTRDLVVVGSGNTTLEDVLASEATAQGRVLKDDPEPEKGYFYRSDHFEFAKKGIPALYTDAGIDFIGKPEGYGEQKREAYLTNDYHKPSDEIKADWDLAGAVEDFRLLFRVGYRVATDKTWPSWKPGTEFKAIREATLNNSRSSN
ncbi:MAG: M28 family metallopeptidase [Bacteroidota bacterium]